MTSEQLSKLAKWGGIVAMLAFSMLFALETAVAQDDALYARRPFDRITVKGGGKNAVQEVQPLDLPGRRVPSPFPSGSIRFKLLDTTKGNKDFELAWSRIEKIELFEQMLLKEASLLINKDPSKITKRDYDEAYFYYAEVMRRFPNTPGLKNAINSYLMRNASFSFQTGEYDGALAMLSSLYERDKNSRGLANAVDSVAGKIIDSYLAQKDYKSARMTLDVVEANFEGLQLNVVKKWRGQFEKAAVQQMQVAERAFNENKFLEARAAIEQAIGVWPDVAGSKELRLRIQRANPHVSVGVFERSPLMAANRIDSWPHRRTASLLSPQLTELVDYSPEGGIYRSQVGEVLVDSSGLQVTMAIAPQGTVSDAEVSVGASALSRDLMDYASGSQADSAVSLARLSTQVSVAYPSDVSVSLKRPHVRPESLFGIPVPQELRSITATPDYRIEESSETVNKFVTDRAGVGMSQVREVLFENEEDAISSLVRGDIQVIDRIPPWQVDRLKQVPGIRVASYKLPTVHVLVPVSDKPLLQRKEFRRALCYGINRKSIVEQLISRGETNVSYLVVSGPFAARDRSSDITPYAYDSSVQARTYDIRLASMLLTLAWTSVQPKVPKDEEPPPLPPMPGLVLAHGSDPVARATCQALVSQLTPMGLNIKLVELSPDELADPNLQGVDLRYAELSAWEPVTDAQELFGNNGIFRNDSDFIVNSLSRLDTANNWNEVRREMFAMHRILNSELPVIPLWQTRNYVAYRDFVEGIGESPITLYQQIDQWQLNFQ